MSPFLVAVLDKYSLVFGFQMGQLIFLLFGKGCWHLKCELSIFKRLDKFEDNSIPSVGFEMLHCYTAFDLICHV